MLPLLDNECERTSFAESYRTLRSNIHFAGLDKAIKSLLITSAGTGEGKTSTVANLGWTMARQGQSVLIIDCDLRNPTLSMTENGSPTPGITDLITNAVGIGIDEAIADGYGFSDLLTLIEFRKESGRLEISDGGDLVELSFHRGRLSDVVWHTRPRELRLATILVRDGLVSQEQMDQAMHRQQNTGHRLGFIIAAMGLLDRAQLTGILSLHVMESLHKVSEMSSTTIHFKETDESAVKKDYPDLVDISQLMTEKLLFSRDLPAIDAGIEELIIELGEHLSLLPSGSIPPNPSELVGSSHLEFILSRLKKKFDFIIIDSPPILPASDALLLTPHVDGVCLVVKASHLNRTMIDRASAMIKETQANLLGVILNEIDAKRDGYYSYYQQYYGD